MILEALDSFGYIGLEYWIFKEALGIPESWIFSHRYLLLEDCRLYFKSLGDLESFEIMWNLEYLTNVRDLESFEGLKNLGD